MHENINSELLDAVKKLVGSVNGFLLNVDGNDDHYLEAMSRNVADVENALHLETDPVD